MGRCWFDRIGTHRTQYYEIPVGHVIKIFFKLRMLTNWYFAYDNLTSF